MVKNVNYKAMAKEIYEWCVERGVWTDCVIYFDGKAWTNSKSWGYRGEEFGSKINDNLYEYDGKNPCVYFEYGNPDTLSMAFDGSEMYYVMNCYWEDGIYAGWHDEFYNLIRKYGCYFELGHAWNLTVVED